MSTASAYKRPMLLMNAYDSTGNNRMGDAAKNIFAELYYTAEQRASDGFNFSPSINQLLRL